VAWPPIPEHWPLFLWSDGRERPERVVVRPPSFLDNRSAGVITGACIAVSGSALAYCTATVTYMAVTHQPLLGGNSFIPAFVLSFPVWGWALAVGMAFISVPRFGVLGRPRRRRQSFGRPLSSAGGSTVWPLVLIAVVVIPVMVFTLVLIAHGPSNPNGQPESNPATHRYWLDNGGSVQYISEATWARDAIGGDDFFTQGAVYFQGIALVVVSAELVRRRRTRRFGGRLPWL